MTELGPGTSVEAFWNSRAGLDERAGTNDVLLSRIEEAFILRMVPRGSRVLELGCGIGQTLVQLVQQNDCWGWGLDASPAMIAVAMARIQAARCDERIFLAQQMIPPVPTTWGLFDVVLSKRCLINIQDAVDQRRVVQSIAEVLAPGGLFLMIESSHQGLANTNAVRASIGLPRMEPPWHNLYFDEWDVRTWRMEGMQLDALRHISSTYHFLSRVVHAKLAADRGEEPAYDSAINRLAATLPQETGAYGPVKAWIWRKEGAPCLS